MISGDFRRRRSRGSQGGWGDTVDGHREVISLSFRNSTLGRIAQSLTFWIGNASGCHSERVTCLNSDTQLKRLPSIGQTTMTRRLCFGKGQWAAWACQLGATSSAWHITATAPIMSFQHAYAAITFDFAWLTSIIIRIIATNPQNPIHHKQILAVATANFISNPVHIKYEPNSLWLQENYCARVQA